MPHPTRYAQETEGHIGEFGAGGVTFVAAPATPIGIAKARIDLPVEQVDDVPGPCVLHFAGRHWHSLVAHLQRAPACWARCAPFRRCRRTR
jgi:hypothetical protein